MKAVTDELLSLEDIRTAQRRIASVCVHTPLLKLEGAGDG